MQESITSTSNHDELTASGQSSWSLGERVVAESLVFVLAWAISSLVFALLGLFHWLPVMLLAAALWVVVRRRLPRTSGRVDRWWVAAIVVALSLGFLNGLHPGEHLLTGRDSGTYLATAGWLANEGTLYVEAREGPLGEVEGLGFAVPGFYDRGDARPLEPQFMHAYPAMLATLIGVGGLQLGLALNAILGSLLLLALFALGRRFMTPLWALVSMGALGSSLVFLYYARTPFTELLMALLVVGGIWLLGLAEEWDDAGVGLLAGVLLGATVIVRLDGLVLLLPVTAYLLIRGGEGRRSVESRTRTGMNAAAVIGIGESLLVSPAYVLNRSGMVVPILVGLLGLYITRDTLGKRYATKLTTPRLRRAAVLCVVIVGGTLLVYGWFVRPLVVESHSTPYELAVIQEREGIPIEPTRNYSEFSVQWLSWYQGAGFVLLGFAGALLVFRRDLLGSLARPGWLLSAVLATYAVLYLWRPSANPDHIWVMRRFLTVVIPLGAVAAGVAADAFTRLAGERSKVAGLVTGSALLLTLLVPPVMVSAPVAQLRELDGLTQDFEAMCEWLEPVDSVLLVDPESRVHTRLTQGLRSFCGVDAAWTEAPVDAEQLRFLAARVQGEGGRLVVASPASEGSGFLARPYVFMEQTLNRAPRNTLFTGAEVTLQVIEPS